jgi:hypothetical protein
MENFIEELPGSQRRVTKKHCDPRILKRVRALFRKVNRKRHVIQVNNLYINVHVDMSQIGDIEQLIMEYNQK